MNKCYNTNIHPRRHRVSDLSHTGRFFFAQVSSSSARKGPSPPPATGDEMNIRNENKAPEHFIPTKTTSFLSHHNHQDN